MRISPFTLIQALTVKSEGPAQVLTSAQTATQQLVQNLCTYGTNLANDIVTVL